MKKARLLLTNDDGIDEPLFSWLAAIFEGDDRFDPYLVVPAGDRSSAGMSSWAHQGISVKVREPICNFPTWAVDGTPVDCVGLGMSLLLPETADLVISGVNNFSNEGRTVWYSGTVGAAIEASLRGVSSIAFSGGTIRDLENNDAKFFIKKVISFVLNHRSPLLLSVNFPRQENWKGVRWAPPGRGLWAVRSWSMVEHPHARAFQGDFSWCKAHDEEIDSDVAWLAQGYVTITPLTATLACDQEALDSLAIQLAKVDFLTI